MLGKIATKEVKVITTGSAGSAVGSGISEKISGFLLGFHIAFNASAPSTTDTTIACLDPAHGTLLTLTNGNTSGFYPVRMEMLTNAGVSTGAYDLRPLQSTLQVDIAQCNALTYAAVVTIYYLEA